ncbi:MAG TPA: transcriptional regulator [Ferrovibrio sp.]|uniref:transcriptional regulator n=1 Tax=Ferrovibrio sp. TaxID=1917215 RepID=UPI002ED4532C
MIFRIAQFLSVLTLTIMAIAPARAQPAQLVMFERSDCRWCLAWHREVGGGYPLSDEGKTAPLRRVDLDGERPGDLAKLAILYTPTFVLVACGRETGRITGYPGADFFYPRLDNLLEQMESAAKQGCADVPQGKLPIANVE